MKRKQGECARCRNFRELVARGLCRPCYQTAWTYGTLDNYSATRAPRAEGAKRQRRPFTRAKGVCARCGRFGELRARGLDSACYEAARRDGTLIDYERRARPSADLIEDYEFLRARGETNEQIARRLGYADAESLRVSLWRARKEMAA